MKQTRLILVGGFLGAGKTTLLKAAAHRLREQGHQVGMIANDQAANLVDTAVLSQGGQFPVAEVAGGCFCCRFNELVGAMERLIEQSQPDVLLAEPVGSCTDLSATVIQPMRKLYGQRINTAPFSVLLDAHQVRTLDRLRAAFGRGAEPRFPDDVMYIYYKQLEEADAIVLSKVDRVSASERAEIEAVLIEQFPTVPVLPVAAATGEGVDAWTQFVMGNRLAGHTIVDVDYDRYALGEAALGWLNAVVHLSSDAGFDGEPLLRRLLETTRTALAARGAEIAHLKLLLTANGEQLAANLTANDDAASIQGKSGGTVREATLLVNARVHLDPAELRSVVENAIQAATGATVHSEIARLESFAPSPPKPVHRFTAIV